jgi:hypothetical protein
VDFRGFICGLSAIRGLSSVTDADGGRIVSTSADLYPDISGCIRARLYFRQIKASYLSRPFFLVEVPLIGRDVLPFTEALCKVVISANARRPTIWQSKEDAMCSFRSHFPWKIFHPEVLNIISVRLTWYYPFV